MTIKERQLAGLRGQNSLFSKINEAARYVHRFVGTRTGRLSGGTCNNLAVAKREHQGTADRGAAEAQQEMGGDTWGHRSGAANGAADSPSLLPGLRL
jgi:hypothetical protein